MSFARIKKDKPGKKVEKYAYGLKEILSDMKDQEFVLRKILRG